MREGDFSYLVCVRLAVVPGIGAGLTRTAGFNILDEGCRVVRASGAVARGGWGAHGKGGRAAVAIWCRMRALCCTSIIMSRRSYPLRLRVSSGSALLHDTERGGGAGGAGVELGLGDPGLTQAAAARWF